MVGRGRVDRLHACTQHRCAWMVDSSRVSPFLILPCYSLQKKQIDLSLIAEMTSLSNLGLAMFKRSNKSMEKSAGNKQVRNVNLAFFDLDMIKKMMLTAFSTDLKISLCKCRFGWNSFWHFTGSSSWEWKKKITWLLHALPRNNENGPE